MAPAAQYFWVLLQERFCSISLRPVGKTEKLSARLCRSGWPLPQLLFPCMLPCSALHILPRHTGPALWQRLILLTTRNTGSFLPALRQLPHCGYGEKTDRIFSQTGADVARSGTFFRRNWQKVVYTIRLFDVWAFIW